MVGPEEERLATLPEDVQAIRAWAKSDDFGVFQDLDLRAAVDLLATRIPEVEQVLIFGSRRFETGSPRSDVDLLVVCKSPPHAPSVASIAREIDSYLDVFIVQNGQARSAVNQSMIGAPNFDALVEQLNAVPLWNSQDGWVAQQRFSSERVLAGFNPAYSVAASRGPDPWVAHADLMFVCALPTEYDAVVRELDVVVPTPPNRHANYVLGEIECNSGTRRVAACVADRAGTVPAALTTFRGIEFFRPSLVVLVGITAGLPGKLELGDLIVPDTIVEYEATKLSADGEENQGRQHATHSRSIANLQAWPRREQWLNEISAARPLPGKCSISTDPMASGNKVVASAERAVIIAAASRKTAAIEMESLGVIEACQRAEPPVSAIVVKAVSDLADEKKDDSWHPFAATAAAQLAAALVRDGVI